jgi:superfamily II DNA or RNA helicase
MTTMTCEKTNSYIYIRTHELYEYYDACKLGKANNIPERDSQYATGEIKRGQFEVVFEVCSKQVLIIERLLQTEFCKYNIYKDSGTEFFNKTIITLIEPYLSKVGIKYKKLSPQEISDLVRCNRVRKTIKKINVKSLIHILKAKRTNKQIVLYTPRNDQSIIINDSVRYFEKKDRGILVLMCGVGKTLISLWVTQLIKSNTILIGVPNKLLLAQWEKVICELFSNVPYLIVSANITIKIIKLFLETNKQKCIIITTYSSVHKVYTASQNIGFIFDMKLLDEVHHLTTQYEIEEHHKTYVKILQIKSTKQLALTATLKTLENVIDMRDEEIIISNTNVKHFGEIITKKCLLSAINENIICDYIIQTLITNQEQLEEHVLKFNITEENDKRLFLSAYASLKSIHEKHSHHLLIYANSKENSEKIIKYIKILLNDEYFIIDDLYYSSYHSEMNNKQQTTKISCFDKAKFGIITCVYCLGEGWDFPLLDAVVFAENMTSNIRIVQSALRASRKNTKEPHKKTKIILPILNKIDWLDNTNNSDWKKVREVIYQMGLEDETINYKIKVFTIDFSKSKKPKEPTSPKPCKEYELGNYDDELTQKLRLKTLNRSALGTTYEKAKKIIAEKNIKSKESYYSLTERDNRLSQDPEETYRGKFTNWIDYLSIEQVYYDLETCKNKVVEYLKLYPEIKTHYLDLAIVCFELCKKDTLFPPNGLWVEYYKLNDLRELIVINYKKKKSTIIL